MHGFKQDQPKTVDRPFRGMDRLLAWQRGLPLFLRIFALVLGAGVGAQILNFAALLAVQLPQPKVYPLVTIGDALRSAQVADTLAMSYGDPPPDDSQDARDRRVRSVLAASLGVDESDLRLVISRPPMIQARGHADDHKPSARNAVDARAEEPRHRAELIVGRFTAAMRLPDGRWRLVSPNSGHLEPWQWHALLWLLGTLLVTAPLAWMLARRTTAPITLFSAAAERLGRDLRAPPLGGDCPSELAAAVTAFNDMQARLKRYVDDRTTMVAAIAHDLRTPLTRLALMLDRAPETVRSAAEAEIEEMASRISQVLAFTRDVSRPTERERLDLRSLIETVADEMADRGADVTVEPGHDAIVSADLAGLRALFANLLENAVRYAGGARLVLRSSGRHVVVDVIDNGPGVPEHELERVFEPFYRLETSRNRATAGTGLGLASARAVARAHGGDLTLSNRAEGGLAARVLLPNAC